jgi:hypothetical protein
MQASLEFRGVLGSTCSEIFRTVHGSGCIDIMHARGLPVWLAGVSLSSSTRKVTDSGLGVAGDPGFRIPARCWQLACARWGTA